MFEIELYIAINATITKTAPSEILSFNDGITPIKVSVAESFEDFKNPDFIFILSQIDFSNFVKCGGFFNKVEEVEQDGKTVWTHTSIFSTEPIETGIFDWQKQFMVRYGSQYGWGGQRAYYLDVNVTSSGIFYASTGNGNYNAVCLGLYLNNPENLIPENNIIPQLPNEHNIGLWLCYGQLQPYDASYTSTATYTNYMISTPENNQIGHWIYGMKYGEDETPVNPPLIDGGTTDTGGGNGDFDDTSDDIPNNNLPSFITTSTGFYHVYLPTLGELYLLANEMWNTDFVSNLKDMFQSPMESIISLFILPFQPTKNIEKNIVIGNVKMETTAFDLSPTSQYQILNFGDIKINEYWGNYLDYSPNTRIQIYLPFLGYKDIDSDIIMQKTLNVKYYCNVTNGSFIVQLKSDNNVFAQYNGVMLQQIPISNYDGSQLISSLISGVQHTVGMIMSGITIPKSKTPLKSLNSVLSNAGSIVDDVMSAKPTINVDGNFTASAGFMSIRYPYLIIKRPRQALPKIYNRTHGYPSFISIVLGELVGFTQIEEIHMENMSCTNDELNEIENLLKTGVII